MRKILFTKVDEENVISSTELVIDLARELKRRYAKKNVYIEENILLPLIRENLVMYLATKKDRIIKSKR